MINEANDHPRHAVHIPCQYVEIQYIPIFFKEPPHVGFIIYQYTYKLKLYYKNLLKVFEQRIILVKI